MTPTSRLPSLDAVAIEERAAAFTRRSFKGRCKLEALKLAVSMMDLTTLEGNDTQGKVAHLVAKALRPMPERYDCPPCAAVCVYPNLVPHAVRLAAGSRLQVAAVATAFPSGQFPLEQKLADVRWAVGQGATEIDMVISRGEFLRGNRSLTFDEIAATKEACGPAHLKVIFETGELQTYDNVRLASEIAIKAGADFIKTSTGKISPAATLPVTLVMLLAVRDVYLDTGKRIGIKPAGGIRQAKEALHYLAMVKEILGDDWLHPDLFRFGASALLVDVTLQIAKSIDGGYQNPDSFSLP
ncbi:MAG: deoxyribose-phosphate aldolase [Verrucomicrobia bacterium]|nr:deoxyribose-phosphate aldolase [Verrucomicrobiota bacterium]